MSAINFERLDAAITHAYEHPEKFNMASWFEQASCGTTACLAGTAAQQAGWKPVFGGILDDDGWSYRVTSTVSREGRTGHVEQVAAEWLGLNEDQCEIFSAENLDEVIDVRNAWAVAAGIPERTWGEQR